MNTSKLISIFGIAILLLGCGSDTKSNNYSSISPSQTKVSGDLRKFIAVTNEPAKLHISEDKTSWKFTVPIKTLKGIDFDVNNYTYKMRVRLMDTNGEFISELDRIEMRDDRGREENIDQLSKFKSFLGESTNGETLLILEYQYEPKAVTAELKSAIDKINQYNLRCDIYEGEDLSDDKIEVPINQNWDKVLDDYEAYTEEYIIIYKKAVAGDADAMSRYPKLMEKASNMQESMGKAQGDNQLSNAQMKRMMEIQAKMMQAAM
jgi:hypothetical protein